MLNRWLAIILLGFLVLAAGCTPSADEDGGALIVPTVAAPATAPAADDPAPVPPLPTPAVTPQATPTPPSDPADVDSAAAPPLPDGYRPANSLLFIADGGLQLWSAVDGSVTRLIAPPGGAGDAPGSVISFHTDDAGRRIAAVRQTALDPTRFDLLSLTIDNPTPQVIARNLPELRSYQVSPDGSRIAYTPGIPDDADAAARLAPLTIYVAPAAGGEPRPFADCAQAPPADAHPEGRGLFNTLCGPLIWTVDGQHLIWRDGEGLRTRGLEATVAYTLLEATYAPPMEDGPTIYSPRAWAPGGRYLLLDVGHWEHVTQAVLDLVSGRLLPVPHVFYSYGPPLAEAAWMADDRLFMVRGPELDSERQAEIYRIPDQGNELLLEEVGYLGFGGADIVAPHHHADGRFGVTLWLRGGIGVHGLVTLESLAADRKGLIPLPAGPTYFTPPRWVSWNEAGTMALLPQETTDGTAERPLLIDVTAEIAYDARGLLGTDVTQALWLP